MKFIVILFIKYENSYTIIYEKKLLNLYDVKQNYVINVQYNLELSMIVNK